MTATRDPATGVEQQAIRDLRQAMSIVTARQALAGFDELAEQPRLSSFDSARFMSAQVLLSHHLRAVLAEIDRQAGA